MVCDHYCNTLRCPTCVRRFWKWAESHTRGRVPKGSTRGEGPSFYEAAAKFWGADRRRVPGPAAP